MDAIELFTAEGKSTGFFICGKCRTVTLNPLYYSGRSDGAKQNTQEAAEACCRKPVCSVCAKEHEPRYYKNTPICDACDAAQRQKANEERLASLFAKATEIDPKDYDGMLYDDGGLGQDGWFQSFGSMVEELGYQDNWPEYVFCAVPEIRGLDIKDAIESQLERICEDGYEDMQIEPDKELLGAIEAFNQRTKTEFTIWTADYSRKIKVPRNPRLCDTCNGDGEKDGSECPICDGTGFKEID